MRSPLLLVALAPTFVAACSLAPDDGPSDSTSSGIKNCPPTNPDYPLCEPTTNTCSGATGSVTTDVPAITYPGGSVTVKWSAKLPANCNASLLLDGQPVGTSGQQTFSPKSSTYYSLTLGSRAIGQAHVQVNLPQTVHIEGSSWDWRGLFVQAINTPGERVVLSPNVDLDLSGYDTLYIERNVTITSEEPAIVNGGTLSTAVVTPGARAGIGSLFGTTVPARSARTLGPRVFTNNRQKPLFKAICNSQNFDSDNININSFRIQGPDFDSMDGDDKLEQGLVIDSCLGVDISNMEFSGWSGAAIYVADANGRQLGPDTVKIHDNFIHHNQHVGGNGYGVDHAEGAWSRIEHNVFDNNRHAITSSGKPGTGYMANENLVLAGGGHHDTFFNSYTQLFDVHGDANCPDIWPFQHTWQCGNAGDQYWFTNNAFQYTNDHAIKIRGTPRIQDIISGNVFTQGSQDDAIGVTQGYTNISVGQNTYGVNTFGEYGVCDFDGDGKDDLFLATGASFWFMSAGKMQWTYLSNYTERLNQVRLGDFDGDHRCDVLAINHGTNNWEIASGGSGPWTALPGNFAGIPIEELATGDFDGDHVTDIFRRDPDGQWWAISPGRWGWTALESSSTPLDHLRFGDFDGNGITDVLGSNGGQWAISWGGRTAWQSVGTGVNDDLSHVYVANVDGVPGDDVVRYTTPSFANGRWDVSSGARTGWSTLSSFTFPSVPGSTDPTLLYPAAYARTFLGRFSGGAAADLLVVDAQRIGRISTVANRTVVGYGRYEY
jgi:hypothetical protein